MRANSPTMNVSLTDALRDVVDERPRSGLYGNASEYVRELIRRDEEAARLLRSLYQAGIDSGESVPMSEGTGRLCARWLVRPPPSGDEAHTPPPICHQRHGSPGVLPAQCHWRGLSRNTGQRDAGVPAGHLRSA